MEKIHISKAKSLAGNFKISRTIICMIFSILFIFTALNIPTPITAYARQAEGIDGSDSGVLERRQAERRWSGREQDGVASEHNGATYARDTITLA